MGQMLGCFCNDMEFTQSHRPEELNKSSVILTTSVNQALTMRLQILHEFQIDVYAKRLTAGTVIMNVEIFQTYTIYLTDLKKCCPIHFV